MWSILRNSLLYFLGLLILVSVVHFLITMIILVIKKTSGHVKDKTGLLWLKKEILHWKDKEVISSEQADNILKIYDYPPKEGIKRGSLIRVLSTIGAVLLGVGVILFVASNWREISAAVKTIMLISVTLGTLYLGYYFSYEKKGLVMLGKSLLFLAAIFWGATLALIGQIYHLPTSGNWVIFLLWAFPILPVAFFFESTPVFLLSSGLFLTWNIFFMVSQGVANYYYPLIVFLILLPLSGEKQVKYLTNIAALIVASFLGLIYGYDWLVLMISLGLTGYYFYKKGSQIYLIGSCLSFALWIISVFIHPKPPAYYLFFIPLLFLFYLTYKDKSKVSLWINIAGAIVGVNLLTFSFLKQTAFYQIRMPFLIFQVLLGVILYLIGMAHLSEKYPSFNKTFRTFGFILALGATYLLSFQGLLTIQPLVNYNAYLVGSFILGAIGLLILAFYILKKLITLSHKIYEIILLFLLIAGSLSVLSRPEYTLTNTVIMNILLLLFSLITILYGFEVRSVMVFNMGILIFVGFVITRYFDILWGLLDRSLFFMIGGLLLILSSIFLEKKRRSIVKEIEK